MKPVNTCRCNQYIPVDEVIVKDSSVDEARSRRIPHHAEVVEVPERLFQVVDEREEVLDRVEVNPKSF